MEVLSSNSGISSGISFNYTVVETLPTGDGAVGVRDHHRSIDVALTPDSGEDATQRTIQVAVPTLRSSLSTDFGELSAGTVVVLIPGNVVHSVPQRRMDGTLAGGAVKV
jgi:hypothetical protein